MKILTGFWKKAHTTNLEIKSLEGENNMETKQERQKQQQPQTKLIDMSVVNKKTLTHLDACESELIWFLNKFGEMEVSEINNIVPEDETESQ